MKEIDNIIKIVSKDEAKILDKNTNVSLITELNNNNYMIRYSGKLTDNIRKLYTKDSLLSENN